MAQKFYVDPLGGKNSNNGLSWLTPKATIQAAVSSVADNDSIVYLAPGTYFQGAIDLPAKDNLTIVGVGNVVINSSGYDYCIKVPTNSGLDIAFENLIMTGFSIGALRCTNPSGTAYYTLRNCTIYQKGALKDVTAAWLWDYSMYNANTNNWDCIGCTFWGVLYAQIQYYSPFSIIDPSYRRSRNCIIVTTRTSGGTGSSVDYNASNQSTFKGTNGWLTSDKPLPVYSEDSVNPDLRFDKSATYYSDYISSGYRGRVVGHFSRPVVAWNDDEYNGRNWNNVTISNTTYPIYGAWINDDHYYNEDFREVIIDSSNNKLDFIDDGTTFVGTIADGTYSDASALMTATATAMNDAAVSTITVVESDQQYTTISTDGTQLELLTQTGTNQATSTWNDLGFNTGSDKIGQTLYSADQPLCIGHGESAPLDAAPVIVASKKISLNLAKEPYGQSGRAISPVIYMKTPTKLKRMYVVKTVDGLGEIDNSAEDAARTLEVRAQNTPFGATDAAGTTTLDWTQLEYAGLEDLDETYSYWQFRAVVRRDKVS